MFTQQIRWILILLFIAVQITLAQEMPPPRIIDFSVLPNSTDEQNSLRYSWEVQNTETIILESVAYSDGAAGSAIAAFSYPPGFGDASQLNAVTITNQTLFPEPDVYFVRLIAQAADGTQAIQYLPIGVDLSDDLLVARADLAPISEMPNPEDELSIDNLSLGYGSEDGLLTLDASVTVQWRVSGATQITLTSYRRSDEEWDHPVRSVPLPLLADGNLELPVAELVDQAGNYLIVLDAYQENTASTSHWVYLDVSPARTPTPLPDYVQEEWLEGVEPVTVCWESSDEAQLETQWLFNNPNELIVNQSPLVQVVYDWTARNVVGEILQMGRNWDDPATTPLLTVNAYQITVQTFLDINEGQHVYPVGTESALALPEFICSEAIANQQE